MISEKYIQWGAFGCGIREIAALGDKAAAEYGEENVYNFTIGNPSVKAPACIEESILQIMKTVPLEKLHGYTPAVGLYEVRKTMAEHLNRSFQTKYAPEDIFMTSGASTGLALSIASLIGDGDELVTLIPYFSEYEIYTQLAGGKLIGVPCQPDTFQPDMTALGNAVNEKTRALLLNSPNNPSGVVIRKEGIKAIAALLTEKSSLYGHPIYIIADEPYRELVYGDITVPFIPDYYNDTVYCYSFSKSLSLAGERVGFLAVSEKVTEHNRLLSAVGGANRAFGYINVGSLFQRVAAMCVGKTADISIYEKNRNFLYTELTAMGYTCPKPDGAFYLFIKIPGNETAFYAEAQKRRLFLVPGKEFHCPGYARLAYCVPFEKLQAAMPVFRELAVLFGLI